SPKDERCDGDAPQGATRQRAIEDCGSGPVAFRRPPMSLGSCGAAAVTTASTSRLPRPKTCGSGTAGRLGASPETEAKATGENRQDFGTRLRGRIRVALPSACPPERGEVLRSYRRGGPVLQQANGLAIRAAGWPRLR